MTEDSPEYGSKPNGDFSQLARGTVGLPEVVAHQAYEAFIQACLGYHAAVVGVSTACTTLELKKSMQEKAVQPLKAATEEISELAELIELFGDGEEVLHQLAGIAVDHWYKNRNR